MPVKTIMLHGEQVAAGTVLAQINPSKQQAVINSAFASMASAQANVNNANAVCDRQKQIVDYKVAEGITPSLAVL